MLQVVGISADFLPHVGAPNAARGVGMHLNYLEQNTRAVVTVVTSCLEMDVSVTLRPHSDWACLCHIAVTLVQHHLDSHGQLGVPRVDLRNPVSWSDSFVKAQVLAKSTNFLGDQHA